MPLYGLAGPRELDLSGNPNLNYPNTIVNFFIGKDEPSIAIKKSAKAYHSAIETKKTITIVPNTGHGVQGTEEGRQSMMDEFYKAVEAF